MKVYTKTGDEGLTGLIGGTRVPKADLRINLYGEVDELNAHIGLLRAHTGETFSQHHTLKNVQSRLFDLGSQMACELEQRKKFKLPDIHQEHITELEVAIDQMSESLPPLKNFVLPAGNVASAQAHVARTVCRRVERSFVAFKQTHAEDVKVEHIKFLNRLSDYLFVLSRSIVVSSNGHEELWKP